MQVKKAQETLSYANNLLGTYRHVCEQPYSFNPFVSLKRLFHRTYLRVQLHFSVNKVANEYGLLMKQENFSVSDVDRERLVELKNSTSSKKLQQRFMTILSTDFVRVHAHLKVKEKVQSRSYQSILRTMLDKTANSEQPYDQAIHSRYKLMQERLNQGKAIVIPTYYHMTKKQVVAADILSSQTILPGFDYNIPEKTAVWVSNDIEDSRFGQYGFALGERSVVHTNPNLISLYSTGSPMNNEEQKRRNKVWIGIKEVFRLHKYNTAYIITPDDQTEDNQVLSEAVSNRYGKRGLFFVPLSESKRERDLLHELDPQIYFPVGFEVDAYSTS